MSDIKNIKDLLAEELKWFPALADDRIFQAAISLITTIESLQGELKAADDHDDTLKRAFHVRESINEKELYDKNKIIESQKEEIKGLEMSKEIEIEHHADSCFAYQAEIESLKAITELAGQALETSEEILRELHSQIGQNMDINPSAKNVYLSKIQYAGETVISQTRAEIERLQNG